MRRPDNASPVLASVQSAPVLPMERCLAKTFPAGDGTDNILRGRNVLNHCHVVGLVARKMLDQMPDAIRQEVFPPGSELIAAAHDIGKASPTFQKRIYSKLTDTNKDVLHSLRDVDADEKKWGGHAGVSQVTAADASAGKFIPEILGRHHGKDAPVKFESPDNPKFGGAAWRSMRKNMLSSLASGLRCTFPTVKDQTQALALSGLTTVADWIGSGDLFNEDHGDDEERVSSAMSQAGFVRPSIQRHLSFMDVFGFPPRQEQSLLIHHVSGPGVYCLEAGMGTGKTEAALYAAYKMMEAGQASGLYFALPTQVTSNRIHLRVQDFLRQILASDSPHRDALLLHGNAWLQRSLAGGEDLRPGRSWFDQSKRGILAPFSVGTVDQALMSVLNVKHGFVRAFGLTGKVVIIDEVHSYDGFTGVLIDELVKLLRSLHCTVIILSATLTAERRNALMGHSDAKGDKDSDAYPLITATRNGEARIYAPVVSTGDVSVNILRGRECEAMDLAIEKASDGQQVLWIENTVAESQDAYRHMSARARECSIECGLIHARFTSNDRAEKEAYWLEMLGKGSKGRHGGGRILVGTQVLEQSLDIDADFLVSRMAPTDILLQRMGRLWRHAETVRPTSARREAWIVAPELRAGTLNPLKHFGNTARVYDPYVLCRSLEATSGYEEVRLPLDIRDMVERTYSCREETGKMSEHLSSLRCGVAKMRNFARIGLATGTKPVSDHDATTRYNERKSVEVLLLRDLKLRFGRVSATLLDGEVCDIASRHKAPSGRYQVETAAMLRRHVVRVPIYVAPVAMDDSYISWLQDYFFIGGKDHSRYLRLAMVCEDGSLRSPDGSPVNEKYDLSYSMEVGYVAEKNS